ncbi:RDD family protein [Bergeyella zoohelcum]|uniref:RDD family n=1 Tax=Bergeyella zoohelcum TaxID=1015 RepID=A0A7Z8YMD2_9FLAO|nr:RDD family protein [Bergeyella zoohelcum]VDH02590.1 RDD family [Bergeyella zoohelcum]
MSEITINTSQNVNIIFNTASIGERMIAFGIDMVIKAAYLFSIYFLIDLFNISSMGTDLEWLAFIIILMSPLIFYTLVSELLMEGQTIGKRIMKIKVIKIDGYQAYFSDYLLRWFFRLIDVYSNGGAIGLITMISSKYNQRLGDLSTGTAVISLKNKVNISHTILQEIANDYIPTFPQVLALSDHDINIIKTHYQNAIAHNDMVVIQKLANKIQSVMKLDSRHIPMNLNEFIQKILQDYNHFTGKE